HGPHARTRRQHVGAYATAEPDDQRARRVTPGGKGGQARHHLRAHVAPIGRVDFPVDAQRTARVALPNTDGRVAAFDVGYLPRAVVIEERAARGGVHVLARVDRG